MTFTYIYIYIYIYIYKRYLVVWSVEQIQKVKSKKVVSTKNGRIMLLSKCSVYNHKKLRFLKDQEDKWLISKLTGVKVSILFKYLSILNVFF